MLRTITVLALLVCSWNAHAADVKISDLPLGSAVATGNNDAFPYVDTVAGITKRLKLSDLFNLPTLGSSSIVYTPSTPSDWSAVPTKVAAALDALAAGGGGKRTTATTSIDVTIPTLIINYLMIVDSTSGTIDITLPDSAASNGFCVDIKQIGIYAVTVLPPAAQTIDGQLSEDMTDIYESRHICAVSGNWFNY